MANYADTYNTANDAVIFQPRCYVAMWLVAQDIIGDVNASAARKDWAAKVMAERLNITSRQLALQVLRNATVAAQLNNATDANILTGVLERLDDLVSIG